MEIKNGIKHIATINGRTLVEIYDKNIRNEVNVKKYVVVRGFVEGRPYGNAWDYAIGYFDTWSYESVENALESAMKCLLNVETRDYDKMVEIVKQFFDYDEDSAYEACESVGFDDYDSIGVEKRKLYDIVEVEYEKTVRCTKKLVVPAGTSQYNIDDYYDSYDICDCDYEDYGEAEIVSVSALKESITEDEVVKHHYSSLDNDIDDLD